MVDPTGRQWRRSTSSYQNSITSGTRLGIGSNAGILVRPPRRSDCVETPLREMLAAVKLGMFLSDHCSPSLNARPCEHPGGGRRGDMNP